MLLAFSGTERLNCMPQQRGQPSVLLMSSASGVGCQEGRAVCRQPWGACLTHSTGAAWMLAAQRCAVADGAEISSPQCC